MRKVFTLITSSIALLAASNISHASDLYLSPYFGADAQYRFMPFVKDFGAQNFRDRFPQGNLYAGLKFCDYLGIEGGYFSSTELSKNASFGRNDVDLNLPLSVREVASLDSIGRARIEGWHVNAVGFLPLSDEYCITALAYVGVSGSKVTLKDTSLRAVDLITGEIQSGEVVNRLSQHKIILRAGAGLQHMITDQVGVRSLVGWENTSKLNKIASRDLGLRSYALAKLKDSVILSFGVFAIF